MNRTMNKPLVPRNPSVARARRNRRKRLRRRQLLRQQPPAPVRGITRGLTQLNPSDVSLLAPSAAAAAYSVGLRTTEPLFTRNDARSTRIVHRELIASVVGSTAFAVPFDFAINPGIATTFPWLSTQAIGWTQYAFRKLRFCYYTRCATSTSGSIMLVPDYNASDAAPVNEQVASSYLDVVEEVPWKIEFCCELNPKAMLEPGNRKYIRIGALAPNLDIKTYDSGQLFVCTTDGAGAVAWGKLWVEYDVDFFVPSLPSVGHTDTNARLVAAVGVTSLTPFGTAPVITGNLAITAINNTLVFNSTGQFLIATLFTGTGFTGVDPVYGGTVAVTDYNPFLGLSGGTTTTAIGQFLVNVTVPGQNLAVNLFTACTTLTTTTFRIAPYATALG